MRHSNALWWAVSSAVAVISALPGTALAGQACTLASAGVGQQATLVCKDIRTGETVQSVPLGSTVSAAGGVGGNLSRRGDRVLATNQAGGAALLRVDDGRLELAATLQTGGEGALSGALGDRGAYVLTGTRLLFFPHGRTSPSSSQALLQADGSASQIALAAGHAYVAEKSGSLEAFLLAPDGDLAGPAASVAGVPAGTIVGITGHDDLVVAPIAHLATNFNQSAISAASGLAAVQQVPTREVAACWTANENGRVCVSNPGSKSVSCGRLGPGGFESYTSVAADTGGASVFDLDVRGALVAVQAVRAGAPVLQIYARADAGSDFLTLLREWPVGTAAATGALLLPSLSR
jgi:hypothetical protein